MERSNRRNRSGEGILSLSQPPYCLPWEVVIQELSTELDKGLTAEEARWRLQQYGPNKLEEDRGVSIVNILVRQIVNAMMLVSGSCFDYKLIFIQRDIQA